MPMPLTKIKAPMQHIRLNIGVCMVVFCFIGTFLFTFADDKMASAINRDVHAQSNVQVGQVDLAFAQTTVSQVLELVKAQQLNQALAAFQIQKKWWRRHKQIFKTHALELTLQIDQQMATIALSFVNKDVSQSQRGLVELVQSLNNFQNGAYTDNAGKTQMTVSRYILQLQAAKLVIEKGDSVTIPAQIKQLQRQWLSVEGYVVSRSSSAYDQAEQDLLLLDAYQKNPEQQALLISTLNKMALYLAPLEAVNYTWLDAALIPLREGLEALLIVGALLSAVKQSSHYLRARFWILGGATLGALISMVMGAMAIFVFSLLSFSQNNQLINGYSGVIASILMIYVCYFLHQTSQNQHRTQQIKVQVTQALSRGKIISFAILAFFSVIREGLESVIFLIGLANDISLMALFVGISVGFSILGMVAWLMLYWGIRLPLKLFFWLSSLLVFYLCFKFMGSGIHGLQLAGVIPISISAYLPSIFSLNVYPSWYSALPQLLLIFAALWLFVISPWRQSRSIKAIH